VHRAGLVLGQSVLVENKPGAKPTTMVMGRLG